MKRILIADPSKASLVITSEVFKDHYPGVQVVVARTAADALELSQDAAGFDAIVIDFDLPDRDGAETAARIKKHTKTPILITGYDRPEVNEQIVLECAGYEDCLNWLRKPVNPDLIVAITERYCEGRYRTQRRVNCEVAAFFELAVKVSVPVASTLTKNMAKTALAAKGKLGKKTPAKPLPKPKMVTTVKKTLVPVFIEDCSLGGLKLRIPKLQVQNLSLASHAVDAVEAIKNGEILSIQLPKWQSIASDEKLNHAALAKQKKTNLNSKTETKTTALPALKTRVAWATREQDDANWVIGVQTENEVLSKKLFDSIVLGGKQNRAHQ